MRTVPPANFIDPSPFEPAMPREVRELVDEARAGRGRAVEWLNERSHGWGQVGSCFGLIRRQDGLTPRQVGWLVGMTAFSDELYAIPDVLRRERARAVGPGFLEAFGAGVAAGVATQPRQWKTTEDVVAAFGGGLPDALVAVLPLGLTSDSATTRTAAQRLMTRAPEPAKRVIGVARTAATGKAAKRLDEALAALGD